MLCILYPFPLTILKHILVVEKRRTLELIIEWTLQIILANLMLTENKTLQCENNAVPRARLHKKRFFIITYFSFFQAFSIL